MHLPKCYHGRNKNDSRKECKYILKSNPKELQKKFSWKFELERKFLKLQKKYLMPQGIHLRNAKCTGRLMMAAEIIHQRKSSTPKEHIFSG